MRDDDEFKMQGVAEKMVKKGMLFIPELRDFYRSEAKKRLTSHEGGVIL